MCCRYISKADKVLHANPPDDDVLGEGDRIVALASSGAAPGKAPQDAHLMVQCTAFSAHFGRRVIRRVL